MPTIGYKPGLIYNTQGLDLFVAWVWLKRNLWWVLLFQVSLRVCGCLFVDIIGHWDKWLLFFCFCVKSLFVFLGVYLENTCFWHCYRLEKWGLQLMLVRHVHVDQVIRTTIMLFIHVKETWFIKRVNSIIIVLIDCH